MTDRIQVEMPDGTIIDAPAGVTKAQILAKYRGAQQQEAPGGFASFMASAGKHFGDGVLTLQEYAGKGLNAVDEKLLGNHKTSITSLVTGKPTERGIVGKVGQWLVDDAVTGKKNLETELAPYSAAHPIAAGTGGIVGDIAVALPAGRIAGGTIAASTQLPALAKAAPILNRLAQAARTSGMRTGAPLAADASMAARAGDLGIRMAGAGITGGASATINNPDHIGMSAGLSALLPPALIGLGKTARYGAGAVSSVIQPFTEKGQDAIAAKIIQRFGAGGPMAVNAAELVPGSQPTLAEATGNAGISTLQRVVRDLRPNAFDGRETANAAARHAAFDKVAGDPSAMQAAMAARDEAANALYGRAFAADAMRQDLARGAQQARAPFTGAGLSGAAEDLSTPGLRELTSRPMFQQAVNAAKQLAANNGVKLDDPLQSLQGLHYVKLALDDALNPAAKTAMGRNATAAVMEMRDKLAGELAQVSPLYGAARNTFAEMSRPINAMEALQGLKLTNAPGNMTLAKVKNAVEGLERLQAAPGINPAKSITPEQMEVVRKIQADLLRQDMLNKGRSAGSNTLQNIATDNILSTMIPGQIGQFVKGKVGGVAGQVGKLAYSGPNEAIRNRLTDMMLTPNLLEQVLARQQAIAGPTAFEKLLELPGVQQSMIRSIPATTDRR